MLAQVVKVFFTLGDITVVYIGNGQFDRGLPRSAVRQGPGSMLAQFGGLVARNLQLALILQHSARAVCSYVSAVPCSSEVWLVTTSMLVGLCVLGLL